MADSATWLEFGSRRWATHPLEQRSRLPKGIAPRIVPLALGLASWGYGVALLRLSSVGLYGLLARADAWFFLGIALIVVGFVLELAQVHSKPWLLAVYLVGLIVSLHATFPLLTSVPEYNWVYKHVGVAQVLVTHGKVIDHLNIYQEWPVLFSAVAALSGLSGVSMLTMASWAPLVFELLNCLVLVALYRVTTRSTRVAFLGAFLFEAISAWIGQNYLSPQAFAYVLWLLFMLIVVRWMLVIPDTTSTSRWMRLRSYLTGAASRTDVVAARVPYAAAFVGLAVYFVIVADHQLTPYLGLFALVPLTVLGVIRPRWLTVAAVVITGVYLITRLTVARDNGLITGFNPLNNLSGPNQSNGASAAQHLVSLDERVLAGAVWLLAAFAVCRRWRAPGPVIVQAILAFTPMLLITFQSYGGEGSLRAFLFAAPWCAVLIASMLVGVRRPTLRGWLIGLALVSSVLLSMEGMYGALATNTFTRAELDASYWLYGRLPVRSLVVVADGNFPLQETANSRSIEVVTLGLSPDGVSTSPISVDPRRIGQVNRYVRYQHAKNAFFVLSPSMETYARYYGTPLIGTLGTELADSSAWQLYHVEGKVLIYKFLG